MTLEYSECRYTREWAGLQRLPEPVQAIDRTWKGERCTLEKTWNGKYYVTYGDDYSDPGTVRASKNEAIRDVEQAIAELKEILAVLKEQQ